MRWTEGLIHVAARAQLRKEGWLLVAGQFPGGSDDELSPLNVVDPVVARDSSPDPRAHSRGKLVPDLVALKDGVLLLVEAKVGYSEEDRQKLLRMIESRREDLLGALRELGHRKGIAELEAPESLEIVPVLAQAAKVPPPPQPEGFGSIWARSMEEADVSIPSRSEVS